MGNSITDVQNRGDGNQYYVIGSGDPSGDHFKIVNSIADRNAITEDCFVLVRNAYIADPTVHRGWAMYIPSGSFTTSTHRTWIKVAEEESVDGPWGIQAEILDMLVRKTVFTAHVNENESEHQKFREWGEKINLSHKHENMEVLNQIADAYGQLTYRGQPIGGGAYVYENIQEVEVDGVTKQVLVWEDPTGKAPAVIQDCTSGDIAAEFCKTSLAWKGQTLQVVEVDHSISSYVIYGNAEDELEAKFVGSVGGNVGNSAVRFVPTLPDASACYVNQGYFFILPGFVSPYKTGHFYECVKEDESYVWVDLTDKCKSTAIAGPKITTCYRSSWNEVNITFNDPDAEAIDAEGNRVVFGKTVVVRKFGSAPTHRRDGVIVVETEQWCQYARTPLTDVCPISKQPVFYGVFSETSNGMNYLQDEEGGNVAEAIFPDWSYFRQVMTAGNIRKLLKLGDVVALPMHTKFGAIEATVTAFDKSTQSVYLTANRSIGKYVFDAAEYGLVPTLDTTFKHNKHYYILTKVGTKTVFEFYPEGEEWTAGDAMVDGIFEATSDTAGSGGVYIPTYNPNFDVDAGISHGDRDWEKSNLKQWLNSKAVSEWFEAASEYDVNGIDETAGFLHGFGVENDFLSLLRRVEVVGLKSGSYNEVVPEKPETVTMWGMETHEDPYKCKLYVNADGTVGDYPEVAHDVVPVFVIGLDH